MGEVVAGKARELKIGDLVKQSAVFGAERQIFADIEIDSATVNKRRFGLIVAGVVANADERVSQRIRGTEEERANAGQRIRPHSASGRRTDYSFARELMDVGLNVSLAKEGIKILLRVARVAVIALNGEPGVEVITVANQKAAALGCVMRDIDVGGVLGQVCCSLNAEFRFVILSKA